MEQLIGSRSRKEVQQGCRLSPCLFNLYAEHMRNAGPDELQAGIKIGGRNINNPDVQIFTDIQMIPL